MSESFKMDSMNKFLLLLFVVIISTLILHVNASNDNNVCQKKGTYYKKGWWFKKKTKYRSGKKICCDGYVGKPPECLRKTAISYKAINTYDNLWTDKGSGYFTDVSIWRPNDPENGYYPLGDVAVTKHSMPFEYSLTVKALESNALAEPSSFEKVWNSKGSRATYPVTIYKMIPKPGYTCLGDAVVRSFTKKPKSSKYRCVNSSYVTTGSYEGIWRSKGAESSDRVKLWLHSETGNYKSAVFANTFTAMRSYSKPKDKPYLLNSEFAKLHTHAIVEKVEEQRAIKVYALSGKDHAKFIWHDQGSFADEDIAIYRAKEQTGYYSLGDIAEGKYSPPDFVFMVSAQKHDAIKKPDSFRQVWKNEWSYGDSAVAFWRPVCPHNYVPLGDIVVADLKKEPSANNIMCVKDMYTANGSWKKIWDDKGSTASEDVTVWRAVAETESGQGILAMSSVSSHGSIDGTAYVLKSDSIEFSTGLPVKQYIITDVKYFINNKKLLGEASKVLKAVYATNKGKTVQPPKITTIEYATEEENNWSTTEGFQYGITVSVTAGIPDVFSASLELSASATYEYQTGGSQTQQTTHSIEVPVIVKPESKKRVSIISHTVIANVPYTATMVKVYLDGTRSTPIQNFPGVYETVDSSTIEVIYGEDVAIKDD